jgi:histidinol-phosphate phosphatase family protein
MMANRTQHGQDGQCPGYVVVIPTLGRASLQHCLDALAAAAGPLPLQVVLADDRPHTPCPLPVTVPTALAGRTTVVTLEGGGPAAARNAGWRAARAADWVVFLDDDVRVSARWRADLAADLAAQNDRVAGVQGTIEVPLPSGRRPTDWERGTAGLAGARWITADMAYRRRALAAAGGFDERFPRAFREDADLALRLLDLGWTLSRGTRTTVHPVRPADRWASVRAQAGNRDDALMSRLHGRRWHRRAGAAPGRRIFHWAACALAVGAAYGIGGSLVAPATARHRLRRAGLAAGAGWLLASAEFTMARVRPGPRNRHEILTMATTSVLIPPLAAWHWTAGWWQHRHARPWPPRPAVVLFDRDGTLIQDVPYNGDPELVRVIPGAAEALARLRSAGIRLGVVTNQSAVGLGLITDAQLHEVNRRVEALLGTFETWAVCPHRPGEGCRCRKPAPGLIVQAAADLGADTWQCLIIGDIGADAAAASAAGARAVLVPTAQTRPEEISGIPAAPGLAAAVDAALGKQRLPCWRPGEHAL